MFVSLNSLVIAVVSFMKCVNFAQLAVLGVDFYFWISGLCLSSFPWPYQSSPLCLCDTGCCS